MTVFDLIRISRGYLGRKISEVKEINVKLGYVGGAIDGWVPLPNLQLPCAYLVNNKCSIHEIAPLICIAFPYFLEPLWQSSNMCYMIRELSKLKAEGRHFVIPKESKYAMHLYDIALSATMYQLNLPVYDIYGIDESYPVIIQRNRGFREMIDDGQIKKLTEEATMDQIRGRVLKQFISTTPFDGQMQEIHIRLALMLEQFMNDTDFQQSNMKIIENLAPLHFTPRKKVLEMMKFFLS